jgi:hypothetical protein
MGLGLVFIAVGVVWLIFRKWIAVQQYGIALELLRRKREPNEDRVKAVEQAGSLFAVLLVGAGLALVLLHVILQS